jgi:hypothetical protein
MVRQYLRVRDMSQDWTDWIESSAVVQAIVPYQQFITFVRRCAARMHVMHLPSADDYDSIHGSEATLPSDSDHQDSQVDVIARGLERSYERMPPYEYSVRGREAV